MTARNRSRGRHQGRGRRHGQFRLGPALGFMLCVVGSFALGFFVLARFIYRNNGASHIDNPGPSSHITGDVPHDQADSRRVPIPSAARSNPSAVDNGPAIGPATDDVQKPTTVDGTPVGSGEFTGANGTDDSALPHPRERPALRRSDPVAPRSAGAPTPPAPIDRGAPGDNTGSAAPATAPATSRSGAASVPSTPRSGPAPDADDASSHTLYRVQIGVYSTREKAEEESRRANTQGYSTRIVPIVSGDRILYRIQQSAYKSRDRAEAVKQKLLDAGFDASVSN